MFSASLRGGVGHTTRWASSVKMRRSTVILVALTLVLFAVVAWHFVSDGWSSIQLSFADEQTEVFADMAVEACNSLEQSPPDVRAAVGFLQYAHNYYPSGTKQTAGSRLDRIVERSRLLAELRIIAMLKGTTGKDFGTDAELWIRELSGEPVAQQ